MEQVGLMEKGKEEASSYSPESQCVNKKDYYGKSDEEIKSLSRMRTIIETQHPSCKDINDSTLRRFLHGNDLDVENASKMFVKYLQWRQTFVPKGFIEESEITNHIAQNKMFVQGMDKRGRPAAVFFGSKHFPTKGGENEFKRFWVFALDKLCSRIPEGQEEFIIIMDLKGFGYQNSDVRGYIANVSILQDYYPERVGKLYVLHASYLCMTMWKLISPVLNKNTTQKIVFVEKKNVHNTLREVFDQDQLPEIYGGKLQLVPIQLCV